MDVVNQVLNWGRSTGQAHIVDTYGVFKVEPLRRELRQMFLSRRDNGAKICGDTRRGYELMIGNERIGVTNGYGQGFKAYYRNAKPAQKNGDCLTGHLMSLDSLNEAEAPAPAYDIPFDGSSKAQEWADDYAIPSPF